MKQLTIAIVCINIAKWQKSNIYNLNSQPQVPVLNSCSELGWGRLLRWLCHCSCLQACLWSYTDQKITFFEKWRFSPCKSWSGWGLVNTSISVACSLVLDSSCCHVLLLQKQWITVSIYAIHRMIGSQEENLAFHLQMDWCNWMHEFSQTEWWLLFL